MEREEDFLLTFFSHVSQLNFDKAKERVVVPVWPATSRGVAGAPVVVFPLGRLTGHPQLTCYVEEQERTSQPQSGPWGTLLTLLPQLAAAERSYMDLGFFLPRNKGFLRKDNSLRSIYDASCIDYRRLEDMARLAGMGTIATVASQLYQFCMARIELIDFYERMYMMSCGRQLNYQELSSHIEDIVHKHAMSFSHMTLTCIKATFSLECEVLVHLLHTQLEMQQWRFLHALMQLHGAHTRIAAWERTLHNKESWTLGFGATFLKTSPLPGLFQWLLKLKAALVAKFSLYFYCVLAMQTVAPEMKALCSKLSCDYYHKMQSFQRRYDASAVMLVFDAHDLEDFPGPGYHVPNKPVERLSGLQAYPIVISCPVKPLNHIPNVAKVLSERASELAAMDKVVFYFSEKEQSTYALALTDPRMSLVVIFDSKKTEKDTFITNFVSELSQQLRCNKVFSSLKFSVK